MQHKDFALEDFLLEETFVDWAKSGEHDAYWQKVLAENPAQQAMAEQAKEIIQQAAGRWSPEEKTALQARIARQLEPTTMPLRQWHWLWAALGAALLLALTWMGYQRMNPSAEPERKVYEQLLQAANTPLLEVENPNEKPLLVRLEDQSTVLLQKGGRLSYPRSFAGASQRVVYLSGEAFFEVAKNKEKPFFVYANELVTKVLGTSFNVQAGIDDPNVVVTVKTGKVAVFSNKMLTKTEADQNRNTEGVVLTPNQQIVFSRTRPELHKSLVQTPTLQALPTIQKISFDFDDAPVSKVFDLLERSYGLDMVYDEEVMANCRLTATMTDEPFFEKLRLICLAIEAEYQVIDAQIVVSSKGCQ